MNSRRHTITSLSIVFLAVTIMSVSAFSQDAFAGHGGGAGMSLSVDCSGSTCDVSGTTDRSGDITLTVTAPNGNIVTVSQISPSGGSFATTIETGGPLWSQDGMYTIKAVQGAAQ